MTEQAPVAARGTPRVLGYSTGGWPIEAYEFGSGPVRLVMIGGIHGGYEWNSILLAYEMIDYFGANPQAVPKQVKLTIIPTANPDGQARTVGRTGRFTAEDITGGTVSGRFNGNDVDLNRNWDCNWKPTGMWLQREISAGAAPFSEIETQILRDFLTDPRVDGVVFWHSAMPGVFAGGCDADSKSSEALADAYSAGSGYPFEREFLGYEVTGEATNWLAAQGIAAISVELTNHSDVDFEQNLSGVRAILDYFSQRSTRDGLR